MGGVISRNITGAGTVCTYGVWLYVPVALSYQYRSIINNNPEACVFALFALFASCSTNTVLRFDPKAHLLVVRAAFLSMLADGDGDGVAMAIRFACCCCLLLLLLLLCFFCLVRCISNRQFRRRCLHA